MEKTLIAVVGPTAIGKTSLAIELAKHFSTEILSADSRQFYKEMSIGTAVPSQEDLRSIPHHFIQHRSIFEPWSIGDYERASLELLDTLFQTRDAAIVVGGSGLYIQALIDGLDHFPEVDPSVREGLNRDFEKQGLVYLQRRLQKVDPEYYELVDIQNPHRLIRALEIFESSGLPYSTFLNKPKPARPFKTLFLGLHAERPVLYRRIEERVDKMMEIGLLEEAKNLLNYKDLTPLQTVGYQEIFKYLEGFFSLEEAVSEIKKNTRRYAKRQQTWFRRNNQIHWFDFQEPASRIITEIETLLKQDHNG